MPEGDSHRYGELTAESTCCGETVRSVPWSTNPEEFFFGETKIPEEGMGIEGFVCDHCPGSSLGVVTNVEEYTEDGLDA